MNTQFAWNKKPAPSYTIPANGPPVMSEADNIKVAIDQLASVRARKSDLEKIEAKLKETLETLASGEHDGNNCKLIVTKSWPERFDGKAFESDHPDLYAAYKRKADKPTRTLTIKALV